jgi:hypothetical protein
LFFSCIINIFSYNSFDKLIIPDKESSELEVEESNVDSIIYNKPSFRLYGGIPGNFYSVLCTFTDSTHFAICYEDSAGHWVNGKVTKIVGIKYIQPDSYSTEEKLIGTWIDGKPLYQVTITGYTMSGGDIDYPINYNIDKIISAECMLGSSDGSNFRPLTYYAGGDYASIICQKTRFHLYLNGISNFTYYLTIKYTKT